MITFKLLAKGMITYEILTLECNFFIPLPKSKTENACLIVPSNIIEQSGMVPEEILGGGVVF